MGVITAKLPIRNNNDYTQTVQGDLSGIFAVEPQNLNIFQIRWPDF